MGLLMRRRLKKGVAKEATPSFDFKEVTEDIEEVTEDVTEETLNYDEVNVKELKAKLDDQGIEYSGKAKKKELFDLVVNGDNHGQFE